MEHQKIDSNLQNNEEKLKAVLNATHDRIVIYDRQLRQLEWHAPTSDKLSSDILDEERRWNLGKSPSEVIGSEKARIHEEAVRKALAGETVTYEWSWGAQEDFSPHDPASAVWLSLKGVLWFYTRVTPLKDHQNRVIGAVSATRKVTELRHTTQSAQSSEAKFQSLVSSVNDMVVTMDYDMYVTGIYGNRNLVAPLDAEEVLGKPFWNTIGPETAALHEEACRSARRGETIIYEWIGMSFEPPRHVQTSVSPLKNDKGQVTGLISLSRDVTVLKQAEQKLRQQEEQLRQVQQVESLGRLAGGIAHDFNNLLTVIKGFCELILQDKDLQESIRRNIQIVEESCNHAQELISQLLAFARRQNLQPKVTNLNDIVSETTTLLHPLIGDQIDLVIRLDPALWHINVDRTQIGRVILNLAVNARDAMPSGGTLSLQTSNITLGEEEASGLEGLKAGDYIRLTIADTGSGMDETTKTKVFEPFFTTKGPGQGTGLGLSMAKGIIQQSSGEIHLESEAGRGTTFTLYFPRCDAPSASLPGDPLPPPLSNPAGTETILVAEDDAFIRNLARQALENYGYTVLTASDGEEALGLAQKHPGAVNLLLTDVIMPRLRGPELVRRLTERGEKIPVLFMTGYTDATLPVGSLSNADPTLIQKPFKMEELVRKVRAVLDQAPPRKSSMRKSFE